MEETRSGALDNFHSEKGPQGKEQQKSISQLLAESQTLYKQICDGSVAGDGGVSECLVLLTALQKRVAAEAIFSPNEEIDDINTEDMPLLLIDFWIGTLHMRAPFTTPGARVHSLDRAENILSQFMNVCDRLKVLEKDDRDAWLATESGGSSGAARSAEAARDQRIARFKRNRAAEARSQEVERERKEALAAGGGTGAREDLDREAALLAIQSAARETLDAMSSIEREREMLQQMIARGPPPPPEREGERDARQKDKKIADRPGLEVTRVSSEGGKLVMKREVVKGGIFKPTVAPPTQTLEEFAALELADAQERAAREAAEPQAPRRIDQIIADGDEDNIDIVDKSVVRDRAWDDWKEDHPKGWGNKANKRF